MKNFDMLATVDRVSQSLGPISSLVDLLMERVAPKTNASAYYYCSSFDLTYWTCYTYCDYSQYACSITGYGYHYPQMAALWDSLGQVCGGGGSCLAYCNC